MYRILTFTLTLTLCCGVTLRAQSPGFDAYGGALALSCPPPGAAGTRAGTASYAMTASASANTITVTFASGVSVWMGNAVVISGTGTAMDTTVGTVDAVATDNSTLTSYRNPQSTTSVTITRTGIGTVGSKTGTLAVQSYYVAVVNNHWWGCTPLGHAMFFTGAMLVSYPGAGSGANAISPAEISHERYVQQLNSTPPSSSNSDLNGYLNLALNYRFYGFNTLFEQAGSHMVPWDLEGTGLSEWNTSDGYPPEPTFGFPAVVERYTSQYSSFRNINTPLSTVAGNAYPLVKRSVYTDNFVRGIVDPFTFDDGDSWTSGFEVPAYYKYMVRYLGGWGANPPGPQIPVHSLHNEFFISLMDESDEGGGTGGGADYPTEANTGTDVTFPVAQPDGVLAINLGKQDVEMGLVGLIESSQAGVVAANVKGLGGNSWLYNASQSVASKAEFASWLQGNTDNSSAQFNLTTSGSLSGTTATITFSGGNNNFPGSPDLHPYIPNEQITVRSCSNSALNLTGGTVISITANSISYAASGGSASGVTGCVVTSGPGYGSIGALNTQWGSNYSSFGTTGTTYTESTGCTGASTFPCAYTVSHPAVTPLTVLIKDASTGTLLAADDGSGPTAASATQSGNLWYNDQAANGGSVTYNTGALSIGTPKCVNVIDHIAGNGTTATATTMIPPGPCFVNGGSVTIAGSPNSAFNGTFTIGTVSGSTFTFSSSTNATAYSGTASVTGIPSGDAISVTYQTGGWGAGTGLLDEDGTCPSKGGGSCWITLAPWARGGETNVELDLEQFTLHWYKWITKSQHDAIKLYFPASIYEPGTVGSWGSPARREILWVDNIYADMLEMDAMPVPDLSCSQNSSNQVVSPLLSLCTNFADNQARVNYIGAYYNGPWYSQYSDAAPPDSEIGGTGGGGDGPLFTTQAYRGLWRQQYMALILGVGYTAGANTGIYPVIALGNWPFGDGRDNAVANTGFMNRRLNWFDGKNNVPTQDPFGYDYECQNYSGQPAGYTWCPAAAYGNLMTGAAAANLYWLGQFQLIHQQGEITGGSAH